MSGVTGWVSWKYFQSDWSEPTALVALLGLAAAAVAFTRRSLVAQVGARAVTWLVFAPVAMELVGRLFSVHSVHPTSAVLAAASGGALWLARPALETEAAYARFAPVRFRSLFLAGATAMTSSAMVALAFGATSLRNGSMLGLAFNAGLAAVLFACVHAVLRMRAWGVLLGGLTSLTLLALAPFFGSFSAVTLCLAALPAILFWALPLVVARFQAEPATTVPDRARYRVGQVAVATESPGDLALLADDEVPMTEPTEPQRRHAAPPALS
jgi:hypothetical protein